MNNPLLPAQKPSQSIARLLHESQFPDGIIKPQMLAATPTRGNGDLYYSNGSTFVRLPVGSNGQKLTVVNGVPAWV